jgi:hypothetical protein
MTSLVCLSLGSKGMIAQRPAIVVGQRRVAAKAAQPQIVAMAKMAKAKDIR